jgi:hypothetical protein
MVDLHGWLGFKGFAPRRSLFQHAGTECSEPQAAAVVFHEYQRSAGEGRQRQHTVQRSFRPVHPHRVRPALGAVLFSERRGELLPPLALQ